MLNIIKYAESKQGIGDRSIDIKQQSYCSFITSKFFPWLFLILLFHKKKRKRPVIFVLLGHYLFRSLGSFLQYWIEIRPRGTNSIWPYTYSNWYYFYAPSNVFSLLGEIIGDWYPLIRTKAVTNNKRNIKIITCLCILYNLVKVYGMLCFFSDYPIDLRRFDEKHKEVNGTITFKIRWWGTVIAIQIVSLFYDLSVIYSLKSGLFDKLKNLRKYNNNSFIEKFKHVSEFRIILSMSASLLFLPFIIMFVISLYNEYTHGKNPAKINLETQIEQLRQTVLSVNFTFMYIDQILLRCFVERNRQPKSNTIPWNSYNNNEVQNITHRYTYEKSDSFQNINKAPDYNHNNNKSITTDDSQITWAYNDYSANKRNGNTSGQNDSSFYINTIEEETEVSINDNSLSMKNIDEDYKIEINNINFYNEKNNEKYQYYF
ncbi:hypothetical protein H8356DRAFT_1653289 [Neocallimastix lanati (nom. inval.)]|jgi:heme/copper-type cytochrome/quinol oxidase subunit 2|uniref:Uncharacterized protein n=1 Tax=Neocallimastix californiae TaxID=1754190 RepID=A0A1Y2F256_9FUNG|nr:hypothetical protein H8356DRAFT_1653289 [Neocallimastix sp. JGI-2020a]ORY77952.1 hypothetical protein LY90DRAFT_501277 [Neocallimastix californiae]|eukprot:ORY77952.1 hypothetical protein LY90DRAFT_501277 [Neocallimastix californiae]